MAQRKTCTKTKSKKRKQHTKKGKVYINPYKIVILCAAVIALCMGLLVLSTAVTKKNEARENQIKIEKQLEQKKLEEQKKREQLKIEQQKILEKKRLEEKRAAEQKKKDELKKEEARKAEEKAKLAEAQRKADEKAKAEKAEQAKKQAEAKKKAADAGKKASEKEKQAVPEKPVTPAPKIEEPVRTPNTETKVPSTPATASPSSAPATPSQPAPAASKFDFPQAKNAAQLVILLDDGGQNLAQLQKFLDLPFPITIAVLPQLAHSKESAAKIRASSGKELMLHQPMQAVNSKVNPGPGAITPDMNEQQIKAMLYRNISEIGPIAGFNNHEGSLITADAEKMETVLKYASENGIYFLDSRTNVDTKVPAVASALGLSYYERNGRFLDNVKTRENAISEIRKNLDIANRDGVVIMIGHIWSADFLPAALMEVYPELVEKGYKFKTVSECRGLKR